MLLDWQVCSYLSFCSCFFIVFTPSFESTQRNFQFRFNLKDYNHLILSLPPRFFSFSYFLLISFFLRFWNYYLSQHFSNQIYWRLWVDFWGACFLYEDQRLFFTFLGGIQDLLKLLCFVENSVEFGHWGVQAQ